MKKTILSSIIGSIIGIVIISIFTVSAGATTVYTYEITEVNGDEVNGIALDNITEENGGIVLSKLHDDVNLVVGDVIQVIYADSNYEEFLDVKVVN